MLVGVSPGFAGEGVQSPALADEEGSPEMVGDGAGVA